MPVVSLGLSLAGSRCTFVECERISCRVASHANLAQIKCEEEIGEAEQERLISTQVRRYLLLESSTISNTQTRKTGDSIRYGNAFVHAYVHGLFSVPHSR